jgi:hypothetical protein
LSEFRFFQVNRLPDDLIFINADNDKYTLVMVALTPTRLAPMHLPIDDCCPICRAPVASATIELAPRQANLALRHYNCPRCGPVEMAPIRLDRPIRLDKKAG